MVDREAHNLEGRSSNLRSALMCGIKRARTDATFIGRLTSRHETERALYARLGNVQKNATT